MKKLFKYILPLMAVALVLVSCEDLIDDKSAIDSQYAKATSAAVSLGSVQAVDYQTIAATASVANPSEVIEEGIQLSTDANFGAAILSIPNDTIEESFNITYGSANYETTYYIRAYAVTKTAGTILSDVQSVTTPTPPLILTWKSLGKATYREDCISTFWNVDNLVYKLDLQECEQIPGYYRLMNPYGAAYGYNEDGDFDASKDYYLEIHAEDPTAVYIGYSPTGCNWGYGEITIYSIAGMNIDSGDMSLADAKAAGLTGTLVDGVLTFPANALLIGMSEYQDGAFFNSNINGMFMMLLPGVKLADYSAEVEYAGLFINPEGETFALGDLALGADVTNAKAVLLSADADPAAVADAILAGEIEAADVEAGRIQLPITEGLTGKLRIVVVVIEDGDLKSVTSDTFEYYGGGANPWKSLGIGYYTDDIVVPLFTEAGESYTYEVEIQENSDTPGLYRIVNCYAPVAEAFEVDGGNQNIDIHAENASAVYILDQPIGLDFGYGDMSIETVAGYHVATYGFDAVMAETPEEFGTLADGIINFPVFERESSGGTLVNVQVWLNMGGSSYFGGTNGEFKIVLPSAAQSVKAKARSMAKATDFAIRLNGGKAVSSMYKTKMAKAARLIKKAERAKLR